MLQSRGIILINFLFQNLITMTNEELYALSLLIFTQVIESNYEAYYLQENACILNWIDEPSYKTWLQVPCLVIPNFVYTSQR